MRFGQLSLRMLLVVIVPLVGVGLLATRAGPTRLVRTGNQYDLAIEGPGYFRVSDRFGENEEFFVRGGTLTVNDCNQICLRVDRFQFLLVPNITIPSDTQKWEIDDDGRVLVWQAGQRELQQQGQVPLYTFPAENIPDLAGPIVTRTDDTGPPCELEPGTGKAGWVKQGYREVAPVALEGKSIGFLLAGMVLGWLAVGGRRS